MSISGVWKGLQCGVKLFRMTERFGYLPEQFFRRILNIFRKVKPVSRVVVRIVEVQENIIGEITALVRIGKVRITHQILHG